MIVKVGKFESVSPEALQKTLKYLYEKAMQAGLRLPAHFIGVAAEACVDHTREGNRPA